MATVPFDAPEAIDDVDDIVDPNEVVNDRDLLIPSGLKGEAPQYISKERKLETSKRAVKPGGKYAGKPFVSVAIEMSELEDQDGNTIKLRRPLKAWVNTLRWPNGPGKIGVKPSTVDDMLKACNMDPTGMTGQELVDAINESATLPLTVHVGWEERVSADENGNYPDPRYRTGDFKTPEGTFTDTITDDDGEEVRAKHVVTYFSRV